MSLTRKEIEIQLKSLAYNEPPDTDAVIESFATWIENKFQGYENRIERLETEKKMLENQIEKLNEVKSGS